MEWPALPICHSATMTCCYLGKGVWEAGGRGFYDVMEEGPTGAQHFSIFRFIGAFLVSPNLKERRNKMLFFLTQKCVTKSSKAPMITGGRRTHMYSTTVHSHTHNNTSFEMEEEEEEEVVFVTLVDR